MMTIQTVAIRYQWLLSLALGLPVALLALGLGFAGYIFFTLDPDRLRVPLEKMFLESTGRQLEMGRLRLSTLDGVGVRTDRVVMRNTKTNAVEGQVQTMVIGLDLIPLAWGQISIQKISLERLILRVRRNTHGSWSISDVFDHPFKKGAVRFDPTTSILQLTRSTIRIVDDSSPLTNMGLGIGEVIGRTYQLNDLDLRFGGSAGSKKPIPLSLQAELEELGQKTVIALEGNLRFPDQKNQALQGDLQVFVEDLQPENWQSYWQPWLKAQSLQALQGLDTGRLDANLHWRGLADNSYQLNGVVGLKSVQWRWPAVWGSQPWNTPSLVTKLDLIRKPSLWQAKNATFSIGNLSVTATGSVNTQKQLANLKISSNDFNPYLTRKSLPPQILTPSLKTLLLQSTDQGNLRFNSQTTGAVAYTGQTLQTLLNKGTITLLNLGWKPPGLTQPLEKLTGSLFFAPGLVTLKQVQGQVAGSPLTLSGKVLRPGEYAASPDLTLESSNLNLNALQALLTSPLVSAPLRYSASVFTQMSGTAQGKVRIIGSALEGQLLLQNATVSLRPLGTPVTDLRGTVLLHDGLMDLKGVEGQAAGSNFHFDGTVQKPTGQSTLAGTLTGNLVFPDALKLLPGRLPNSLNAYGTAPIQVTFTPQGTSTQAQIQGDFSQVNGLRVQVVERQKPRIITRTVLQDDGTSTFETTEESVAPRLTDLMTLANPRQVLLTAMASPDQLRIQNGTVQLNDFNLQFRGTVARWQTARASMQWQLTSDAGLPPVLGQSFPWIQKLPVGSSSLGQVDLALTGTPDQSYWSGGLRSQGAPLLSYKNTVTTQRRRRRPKPTLPTETLPSAQPGDQVPTEPSLTPTLDGVTGVPDRSTSLMPSKPNTPRKRRPLRKTPDSQLALSPTELTAAPPLRKRKQKAPVTLTNQVLVVSPTLTPAISSRRRKKSTDRAKPMTTPMVISTASVTHKRPKKTAATSQIQAAPSSTTSAKFTNRTSKGTSSTNTPPKSASVIKPALKKPSVKRQKRPSTLSTEALPTASGKPLIPKSKAP